jgi:hypothetical protein
MDPNWTQIFKRILDYFRFVRHSGRIRSLAASTSTFLAESVIASDILAIVGAADPFNVIAARRLKESCRNE